tara:strand:+ start:332 stop:541 length:210 start_codon:yes stop_codon:yes gene_type:complete
LESTARAAEKQKVQLAAKKAEAAAAALQLKTSMPQCNPSDTKTSNLKIGRTNSFSPNEPLDFKKHYMVS